MAFLCAAPAMGAGGPRSAQLSAQDRGYYINAFRAVKKRDWAGAHRWAAKAREGLPAKAVAWLHYREPGNRAGFSKISAFVDANPDWPSAQRLIRRAEEAMEISRIDDNVALAWFTKHRPLSGPGQLRLAEAMLAAGSDAAVNGGADAALAADGKQWLRHAWINNTFPRRRSKAIYRRHRKIFSQEDHMARLDWLLWQGHRYSARRLYSLVPKGYRKLAEARESLMVQGPGVDSKISAVPREWLADSGLAYERLRWRRRKRLDERAREILLQPRTDLGPRPKRWWLERHIQTRMAQREGKAGLAYRLATGHRQTPGSFAYAQAEWLSGWIALRYLHDGAKALGHFAALYKNVRFPVSLARAAYWAGRANQALGRGEDSTLWYSEAARYPATYYGQLAVQALGPKGRWRLPKEPVPTVATKLHFDKRELVRLSHMLHALRQPDHLRPFILHLAKTAATPPERKLVARLAGDLKQPDLAVRTAKISLRAGTLLARTGYPILAALPPMKIEVALAHAVARQESEFDAKAISSASARGLMQLLPRTARKVAKSLGLRYRKKRLFEGRYNMRLGAAYLGQLIKAYRGSYIMALAAYNAGPNRVRRWLRQNGDPRKGVIDPIDWVEAIPISETRNYVQRVMENLQVYRWRLQPRTAKLALLRDLHRNGPPTQ
ncbi:MAG: lytic transglycosylase domain-containing protein [Alphaproteobacteria bacterium]